MVYMFFILLLFAMDVLCEDEDLYIHSRYVFLKVSTWLHLYFLHPNEVTILELNNHMRTKLLESMHKK